MELHDFVKATLVHIITGIKEAQAEASEAGAAIVPIGQGYDDHAACNRVVDFDVAITTGEGTQTKGGIGIFVGAIGLGSQGQSDASTQAVNRVRFSVPVYLPSQRIPR